MCLAKSVGTAIRRRQSAVERAAARRPRLCRSMPAARPPLCGGCSAGHGRRRLYVSRQFVVAPAIPATQLNSGARGTLGSYMNFE
ncbi:hypothetical protein EVAR_66029_1 [Eumeta japonica]|uniref:Uncharacterized protein n=1 Tax=Eumeta variegata TaxID=151549 RepID=A0A4C1Z832_EUMVA|nr:hypothetical protein EVAR_66029_1 [Eumeta japonica]